MIIAFDGNVFTGKTSLIKALSVMTDSVVINEHSDFLDAEVLNHDITSREAAISLQLKYLDAEERRCNRLKPNKMNLVDRSFVSMAAHIFALNHIHGVDIREWFLQEIQERIESKKVMIPDVFCFVKCERNIIIKRVHENNSRNTASTYYAGEYLDAIEYFNQNWADRVGSLTIDTDTILPIGLAKTLIQRISVPCQGTFSTKQLYGYLRELLMQEYTTQRRK